MKRKKHSSSPFAGMMYLQSVYTVKERIPDNRHYPFNLPFVRGLDLVLDQPITFFVGENGSGKSTLLEAIASLCNLPVDGGGKNEIYTQNNADSGLAQVLRPRFRHRPRDGFFFRAETLFNFATLLEQRDSDPDFSNDPYARYSGKSLHQRSHGEAFLDVLQSRIEHGLFLLDEPEAALSPQRQLSLLYLLQDHIKQGKTQFIIATHSPIILTFPNATIINFDDGQLQPITIEETRHYQITRGILTRPDQYWKLSD